MAALALGGVVVGLEGRQLRDGGRRDRAEGRELEPTRRRLAGRGEPAERRAGGPAVVEEELGVARPRPAARDDVGPAGRPGLLGDQGQVALAVGRVDLARPRIAVVEEEILALVGVEEAGEHVRPASLPVWVLGEKPKPAGLRDRVELAEPGAAVVEEQVGGPGVAERPRDDVRPRPAHTAHDADASRIARVPDQELELAELGVVEQKIRVAPIGSEPARDDLEPGLPPAGLGLPELGEDVAPPLERVELGLSGLAVVEEKPLGRHTGPEAAGHDEVPRLPPVRLQGPRRGERAVGVDGIELPRSVQAVVYEQVVPGRAAEEAGHERRPTRDRDVGRAVDDEAEHREVGDVDRLRVDALHGPEAARLEEPASVRVVRARTRGHRAKDRLDLRIAVRLAAPILKPLREPVEVGRNLEIDAEPELVAAPAVALLSPHDPPPRLRAQRRANLRDPVKRVGEERRERRIGRGVAREVEVPAQARPQGVLALPDHPRQQPVGVRVVAGGAVLRPDEVLPSHVLEEVRPRPVAARRDEVDRHGEGVEVLGHREPCREGGVELVQRPRVGSSWVRVAVQKLVHAARDPFDDSRLSADRLVERLCLRGEGDSSSAASVGHG